MFNTQMQELNSCKNLAEMQIFLHIVENNNKTFNFAAIIGSKNKEEYIYMEKTNITENCDEFFVAFTRLMSCIKKDFNKSDTKLYLNFSSYWKLLDLIDRKSTRLNSSH